MSADVEQSAQSGTVEGPRPYERFVASLQRRAQEQTDRGHFELTANQMDKILTAETDEEIWDADEGGLIALKDLVGAELRITEFHEEKSTDPEMDNGLGVFIVGTATLLNDACGTPGEEIQFNSGVATVITKLESFRSRGTWPLETLVTGVKSKKGEMVRLRPVPRRVTKAETAG
jgi:hypothetical protein